MLRWNGIIPQIAFLLSLGVSRLGQTNSAGHAATQNAPEHPSETDLYETVLRYETKLWEFAAASYCVQVNGKDPGSNLLERLKPVSVKPASACREQITQLGHMEVVERETGKLSIIFDVGEIRWLNPSEAEVDGGYLCGSQCMAGGAYHVKWDAGRWIVTNFHVRLQS